MDKKKSLPTPSPTPLWLRQCNTWSLHGLKWKLTWEPPTWLFQNECLHQPQVPPYLVNHLHLAHFPIDFHLEFPPIDSHINLFVDQMTIQSH